MDICALVEENRYTMWSPLPRKQLGKAESPLPELVASPVSSASSSNESPPLSPLQLTYNDEKIEKSDHDDDIRSNPFSGENDMSYSGMCDFSNLFQHPCQVMMSPWMRVFDIDDTGSARCEENRVARYRETRFHYLSGRSEQGYDQSSKEPCHRSLVRPKQLEFSQNHRCGKRRSISDKTRDGTPHQLGYLHFDMSRVYFHDSVSHNGVETISQQIGSVCVFILTARLIGLTSFLFLLHTP